MSLREREREVVVVMVSMMIYIYVYNIPFYSTYIIVVLSMFCVRARVCVVVVL